MCFLLVKERPGLSRCVKDGPASLGKGHSAEEAVPSLASVLPHREVQGKFLNWPPLLRLLDFEAI